MRQHSEILPEELHGQDYWISLVCKWYLCLLACTEQKTAINQMVCRADRSCLAKQNPFFFKFGRDYIIQKHFRVNMPTKSVWFKKGRYKWITCMEMNSWECQRKPKGHICSPRLAKVLKSPLKNKRRELDEHKKTGQITQGMQFKDWEKTDRW